MLPSLLPEFAGKVNLIYIDPPFDTGADFSFSAKIPGSDESFTKEPSILEQKAYRDTWGHGLESYLNWFYETVVYCRELLHENGSLYCHLDLHVVHYAKCLLDEVFGSDTLRAEIIWKRATKLTNLKNYGIEHDTVLFYSKSQTFAFEQQYKPLKEQDVLSKYIYLELPDGTVITLSKNQRLGLAEIPGGRRFRGVPVTNMNPNRPNLKYEYKGMIKVWATTKSRMLELEREGLIFQGTPDALPMKKQYLDEVEGAKCNDVWDDIPPVNSQALERTGYATQKPEELIERILKTSSKEHDLVLDCFVGSGTTAAVAERLNRRWIAADLGRFAIHTARKRLLEITGVTPFAVQNLGKYERQAWQASEFNSAGENALEGRNQQEKAYREFILDLYHATVVKGHQWLHGIKSGRMVHVGAVDAPVTLSDVKSIAREVWKTSTGTAAKVAADVLGWEFAFELNETARQVAAESRVDISFKKIPREVLEKKAVQQGDVKFFELGALSVESKLSKSELVVQLTDFVIPIDDVPEDARKVIKRWHQMIDYWAVDWDFKGDTFHNQWQSYRTRSANNIELKAKYEYATPGDYKVVVKVIDILGNDTTKTVAVRVK